MTSHLRLAALAAVAIVAVVAVAAVLGSDGVLLWLLLGVAAVAIVVAVLALRAVSESNRYLHQLEHSQREFRRALGRMGSVLEATHDRRAIVDVAGQTAMFMAGAECGAFYRAEAGGLHARVGWGSVDLEGIEVVIGSGVAGSAAGADLGTRFPPGPGPEGAEPTVATALAVPLHARDALYGVLALYGRSDSTFDDDDLDAVRGFVRQAEAAVENTFLHEEAQRLSITDGLTGLWNRRQFDVRCSQELERAVRFGEGFAIVMCDIDGFKAVNDASGHRTGDAVLVELARRLTDATREVDLVARYGGEEFVLVLPRTDVEGAMRVAEKVRRLIAAEPVLTEAGPVAITMSFGVANHPEHGETCGELVAAADDALYVAKRSGKDRVSAAGGAGSEPDTLQGVPSPAAGELL